MASTRKKTVRVPYAHLRAGIDRAVTDSKERVVEGFKALERISGRGLIKIAHSQGMHVGLLDLAGFEGKRERVVVLKPLTDGTYAVIVQDAGGYDMPLGVLVLAGD